MFAQKQRWKVSTGEREAGGKGKLVPFLSSRRRPILPAAIKLPNAATVNQRLSRVSHELNLFFLFLEVKPPRVLRTPKEAAAAVIQGNLKSTTPKKRIGTYTNTNK